MLTECQQNLNKDQNATTKGPEDHKNGQGAKKVEGKKDRLKQVFEQLDPLLKRLAQLNGEINLAKLFGRELPEHLQLEHFLLVQRYGELSRERDELLVRSMDLTGGYYHDSYQIVEMPNSSGRDSSQSVVTSQVMGGRRIEFNPRSFVTIVSSAGRGSSRLWSSVMADLKPFIPTINIKDIKIPTPYRSALGVLLVSSILLTSACIGQPGTPAKPIAALPDQKGLTILNPKPEIGPTSAPAEVKPSQAVQMPDFGKVEFSFDNPEPEGDETWGYGDLTVGVRLGSVDYQIDGKNISSKIGWAQWEAAKHHPDFEQLGIDNNSDPNIQGEAAPFWLQWSKDPEGYSRDVDKLLRWVHDNNPEMKTLQMTNERGKPDVLVLHYADPSGSHDNPNSQPLKIVKPAKMKDFFKYAMATR